MELLNQVRAYHYLAGVLTNQQRDLFCHRCSAWNNTLNNTREALIQFEAEHAAELRTLSPEAAARLTETRSRLAGLVNAANPAGQKEGRQLQAARRRLLCESLKNVPGKSLNGPNRVGPLSW